MNTNTSRKGASTLSGDPRILSGAKRSRRTAGRSRRVRFPNGIWCGIASFDCARNSSAPLRSAQNSALRSGRWRDKFQTLRVSLFTILLVACGANATPTPTAAPTTEGPPTPTVEVTPLPSATPLIPIAPGNRLGPIKNYTVYYGVGQAEALTKFDLAIVQPKTLTADEVRQLQAGGTKVVAYLSVGEAEGNRPWWPKVDYDWILGRNPNWGSLYIDAGQVGWQDLLLNEAIPNILQIPFDGLFLDTLDTVDVYPDTLEGMVTLVHRMRVAYPELILIQNRGFSVLDRTAPDIDALMFEAMSSNYDFSTGRYSRAEREEEPNRVRDAAMKHGLVALALDYAKPEDLATIQWCYDRARDYGFVPYVSTINLDRVYVHELTNAKPNPRPAQVLFQADAEGNALVTIRLTNWGLADAPAVPIRLLVGREHTLLAQTTLDLPSGQNLDWEVTWPNPPEALTLVRVEAGPDPKHSSVLETTFQSSQIKVNLSTQQLRKDNGADLHAWRLLTPPTIDGDLNDWASLTPAATIDQANQVGWKENPETEWDGASDLSAVTYLGWDDDALYIAAHVTDDVLVQHLWGEGLWKGDHLEFWLDTQLQSDFDAATPSEDDFQFGFSPGAQDASAPADFAIWQPALLRADYESEIQYASQFVADGYVIEAQIPWRLLRGVTPQPGLALGVAVDPSDTDTPDRMAQELIMSTAPASPANWGNPTLLNNLFLEEVEP
jgi:uncharacterized protein (TIGR01370 family)